MKRLLLTLMLCGISTVSVVAQNASDNTTRASKHPGYINAGVGVSGWGIPIYASLEFGVGPAITIDAGISYQSKSESYRYTYSRSTWTHTIIGLQAAGHYYLDSLLSIPKDFDLYGGASLGYWIWETKLQSSDFDDVEVYNGAASGGFGIGILIGGRYFFSDNIGLALELGGGTILSSGRLGLSVQL